MVLTIAVSIPHVPAAFFLLPSNQDFALITLLKPQPPACQSHDQFSVLLLFKWLGALNIVDHSLLKTPTSPVFQDTLSSSLCLFPSYLLTFKQSEFPGLNSMILLGVFLQAHD